LVWWYGMFQSFLLRLFFCFVLFCFFIKNPWKKKRITLYIKFRQESFYVIIHVL
jgi:hypothetical protein